jgi:hypothetical protein
MVELLSMEKSRLIAENGTVTSHDFDAAWQLAWQVMVAERAWPHATKHRRAWRAAMLATRSEARAAFLGEPTAFAHVAERLSVAAAGMCVTIEAAQIPKTLLAAIALVETADGEQHLTAA